MIELVSTSRCIACNICVKVCPTNVFDIVPDAAPVIARQSDCQTCFFCEAYCPVDALFVAPEAHQHVGVNELNLTESGQLGSYRKALGWARGGSPAELIDRTHELRRAVGTGAIG
jgi:NAD-dependent dihydropyrimidine dehydrogenase PreA subunit